MPTRRRRLGSKLMLITLVALVLFGAASGLLVTRGFRHTQREVIRRSVTGLEVQGQESLAKLAEHEAEVSAATLRQGLTISRQAARYVSEMAQLGGALPADPGRLTRERGGQLVDPAPGRRSNVFVPSSVPALDAALERDLRESAVLDAIFPALEAGADNPVAIYYTTPRGLTRSYPVGERAKSVPPDYVLTDDPSYRDAAPAANPGRETILLPPALDPGGRSVLVTMSTPVYAGDEFRGVVSVDLALDQLIANLGALRPSPTGYAFLVDREGGLVAAPSAAVRDLTGLTLTGSSLDLLGGLGIKLGEGATPELRATLATMQAGGRGVDRVDLNGRPVFVAYAPLEGIGWRLALVTPLSEITAQSAVVAAAVEADAARTIVSTLIAMAAVFLLAILATSLLSHRLLTRPIAALVAGTRAVAAGDLGVRIPLAARDELGTLAASFNRMTTQLAAVQAHLRQRTDELTGANRALEAEVGERRRAALALRESEEQYRGIFEATGDGLVIRDLHGTIVAANPAMYRMHGYEHDELVGRPLRQLVHPDHQQVLELNVAAVQAGEEFQGQSVNLRRDGTPLHVEIRGSAFTYRGEPHVLSVIRDVTERIEAYQLLEQRVAERTRELATLLDVAHDVASTLELQPLLRVILDQMRAIVDYEGVILLTLEGDQLVPIGARFAGWTGEVDDALRRPIPVARLGAIWEPLRRREAVLIGDTREDTPLARAYHAGTGERAQALLGRACSWLAVPLVVQQRVIGVLALGHAAPHYYTPRHAALALTIAGQAAAAIENARLYAQAQSLAALEERQRLARELHDSVSQALYGIALGAKTARTLLDRDPTRVAKPLDYVLSLAEAGLAEMRALIFELRPESLEQEGLVVALEKQAGFLRARHQLAVDTDLRGEPDLPLEHKEALYRIAQEALHNTVKHAGAKVVTVRLHCAEGVCRLDVSDDGRGFDPSGSFPGHLGLTSMRERVARLGGTLRIDSAQGTGTRLCACVPMP